MFKSLSVTLLMGQSWSPCPLLPKLSCPWVVAVLLPGALGQQTGPVLRAAAQMFVLLQRQGLTGKGLLSCATGASITPDKGKGHFQGHWWQGWQPLHQPLLTAQHRQLAPSSSYPWVLLQAVFLPNALNARPAVLSSIRKED